jgi:hypothetical protein
MAKKKTEKKEVAEVLKGPDKKDDHEELLFLLKEVGRIGEMAWNSVQKIELLNQRIDKIIDAHEACRKLKGL